MLATEFDSITSPLCILTCRMHPIYTGKNSKYSLSTEWFKNIINKKVREIWDEMINQEGDPSLFFNRDIDSSETRIDYPLIIYHFIKGDFYITGIVKEKGVKSLEILASSLKNPFVEKAVKFSAIEFTQNCYSDFIIGVKEEMISYSLVKWIPFHHLITESYNNMTYIQKADFLNEKLFKHIVNFCKKIRITTDKLQVEIMNVTNESDVLYEKYGYKYKAFDIEFKSNINLPAFITLGNMQSFGYGRVE